MPRVSCHQPSAMSSCALSPTTYAARSAMRPAWPRSTWRSMLYPQGSLPMRRYRPRDDDEEEIIPDGATVRVPMFAMDSLQRNVARHYGAAWLHDGRGNPVGHKPGFVVSDAFPGDERQQAYDSYERELVTAWQGTGVVDDDNYEQSTEEIERHVSTHTEPARRVDHGSVQRM